LSNWFREQFGCTTRRKLTARWHGDWLCRKHALFCREIITDTAGFAAKLMLMTEQDLRALRFGQTVERVDEVQTDTAHA
jgi:hypothetical protein